MCQRKANMDLIQTEMYQKEAKIRLIQIDKAPTRSRLKSKYICTIIDRPMTDPKKGQNSPTDGISTGFVSQKLILKVKMVNRVIFSCSLSSTLPISRTFCWVQRKLAIFCLLAAIIRHRRSLGVCADFQIIDSTFITRCHAIITSIIGLNFLTSKLTWKTLWQISSSDMGLLFLRLE